MSNKNPYDVIGGANVSLQLWNGTTFTADFLANAVAVAHRH